MYRNESWPMHDASERRAAVRANVNMQVVVLIGGGGSVESVVRNLSTHGCLIDASGFRVGDDGFELALPGMAPVGFAIVHFDGSHFGCRFPQPIAVGDFDRLIAEHAQNRPQPV